MEYGGYPGMMGPGAGPMYGYEEPGAGPGFFGGVGQSPAIQQQAAANFGSSVTQFAGLTAPSLAVGAYGMMGMFGGPLLHSAGMGRAGLTGMAMRGAGTLLDYSDPFSIAMAGGRGGFRLGRALGAMRIGRFGLGAVGRGALTGTLAFGGFTLPLAAGMAAMEAPIEYGRQMFEGASNTMAGQALMSQIGPSIAPGQNMAGQGQRTGLMMREMSESLGVGMEDVSRYARQLDSAKMFQTTKSAEEFRTKFKEVMSAVKEIAKSTQSTVDEAMKTFTDLRMQGFYTTADIKAQAVATKAQEIATGLAPGTLSQVGAIGSQTARSMGMRGRFGAQLMQREVAGVSMGVRSGAMSEEEVMEMGGVEAVGMNLASQQMRFLGTARGRAVIAAMMGGNGAPDASRLNRFLGGSMTMEDLVTTAAGRGLGVLQQAGGREAREQFMPYASMAMIQMAASQQRQLYGGVSRQGILGMLGTMGMGRQESEIMLQQAMQMPQQMRQERQQQEYALTQAEAERIRGQRGMSNWFWSTRAGEFLSDVGSGARQTGSALYGDMANLSQTFSDDMTRQRVFTRGSGRLGREYLRGRQGQVEISDYQGTGAANPVRNLLKRTASYFDGTETQDDIATRYLDYEMDERHTLARLPMREEDAGIDPLSESGRQQLIQRAIQRGEISRTREGRYVRTEDARRADEIRRVSGKFDKENDARANLSLRRGDYLERLEEEKNKVREQSREGYNYIREDEEAFNAYFLGKESGEITQSFMEWRRSSSSDSITRMKEVAADKYQSFGDQTPHGRDVLTRLGRQRARSGDAISAGDLERSQKDLDEQIDIFMRQAAPGLTGSNTSYWGVSSGGRALTTKLQKDGQAREMFQGFIESLGSMKPEEVDAKMAELRANLSDDEFRAVQEIYDRASTDDTYRQGISATMAEGGNMRTTFARHEATQMLADEVGRGTEGAKFIQGRMRSNQLRLSENATRIVNQWQTLGATGGRSEAMTSLIQEFSAGGLDEREQEILNRLGGTSEQGGAQGLAAALGGLTGGSGEGISAALESLNLDPEKKAKYKEMLLSPGVSGEEKTKIAMQALKEGGGANVNTWTGDTTGEQSIEGVQKQYIETNYKFVQAVHAFVSAIGDKIPGMPAVPGPESLQDTNTTLSGSVGGAPSQPGTP